MKPSKDYASRARLFPVSTLIEYFSEASRGVCDSEKWGEELALEDAEFLVPLAKEVLRRVRKAQKAS